MRNGGVGGWVGGGIEALSVSATRGAQLAEGETTRETTCERKTIINSSPPLPHNG